MNDCIALNQIYLTPTDKLKNGNYQTKRYTDSTGAGRCTFINIYHNSIIAAQPFSAYHCNLPIRLDLYPYFLRMYPVRFHKIFV